MTKSRFGRIVFFMVTWPGPKSIGDGTQADGVSVAMEAAMLMTKLNAAILILPPLSNATPILKNNTIVTTFERKLVITREAIISIITMA